MEKKKDKVDILVERIFKDAAKANKDGYTHVEVLGAYTLLFERLLTFAALSLYTTAGNKEKAIEFIEGGIDAVEKDVIANFERWLPKTETLMDRGVFDLPN